MLPRLPAQHRNKMDGAKQSVGTLRIHKDDDCEFGHSYDVVATFPQHERLGAMDGAQVFIADESSVTLGPAQWADVYYFARAVELPEFISRAQEVFEKGE
jgi:hypothetical protein